MIRFVRFALLMVILTASIPTLAAEPLPNSEFNPATASWEIDWPGRVAKHDLVYLTPPVDPMQGIPLGNGDIGVLCWCEDTKLIFAINKCDLWDDAAFTRFHNWKPEEEEFSTTLRHACRLIIDFQMPVFDLFYLSDFTARLSLADASLTIQSRTPFGAVSVRAFVSQPEGVLCCTVTSDQKENVPVQARVERYGSRTFSHWYRMIARDPALGLEGTDVSVDDANAYLTQRLNSGVFAVGCNVIGEGNTRAALVREHSRAARIDVSGETDKEFSLVLSVTSPTTDDAVAEVKKTLAASRKTGIPALFAAHAQAWKTFWLQSLMESGDDYLDNLWHLTMYYANASQRGPYPGRFLNGLWTWNRDVQNWNFYFHWNQQQVYWPLNAAGHADLVDSYLNYRTRGLPSAQLDAREIFHADGAFVSDVCDRRGMNSESESANHTPVAQIAMDFWRQYQFTGDNEFLEKRAAPYIVEAAKFFESLFARGEDGRYHAVGGTGYEGWIRLSDVISELVYAKVLFSTALAAVGEAHIQEPRAEKWKDILDHLAPLPTVRVGEEWLAAENGTVKLKRGLFKGSRVPSDSVFAAGFGVEEKRMLTSLVPSDESPGACQDTYEILRTLEANKTPYTGIKEDIKYHEGIFPWVEFVPVFPSGLVGLSGRTSPEFETAVNTAKVFANVGMGFDPLPIVLARLGLSDELDKVLSLWPGRWQFYCNGWGHYGPRDLLKADAALRFRTTLVKDAALPAPECDKAQFPFPDWPFRHMGMESMSVLTCAMNEALLQSYDGVIRVAPAAGKRTARFTLHATNGFVVSGEIEKGEVRWLCIVSQLGKPCKLENPWDKTCVYKNGSEGCRPLEQGIQEFPTNKGDVIMIAPDEKHLDQWTTTPVKYEPNQNAKTDSAGKATLGLPRMF